MIKLMDKVFTSGRKVNLGMKVSGSTINRMVWEQNYGRTGHGTKGSLKKG